MIDFFQEWDAGNVTDTEAYNALVNDRAEIEEVYQRAKAALDANRAQIERIVSHAGGKMTGAGYEATMVQGGEVTSYNTKALDALMAQLLTDGDIDTAHKLAQARRVECFRVVAGHFTTL